MHSLNKSLWRAVLKINFLEGGKLKEMAFYNLKISDWKILDN
jgi:hypothetical protein